MSSRNHDDHPPRTSEPVARATEALSPEERGALAARTLARRATLTVTGGGADTADAGRTITSTKPRVIIGTHESADLVVSDPTVSRFHCEIELGDSEIHIRDLGSMNGTWVDGVRIGSAYLGDGAMLTAGRTRIRFDLGAGHIEIPTSQRGEFGLMVGRAPVMRAVFATLEKAAASDATVLILGETGTGKEVTAESIHRESARSDGPFIFVDCGAIPPDLLESELFGHERGAFTGAVQAREGAFEAASGGTIFLDEIGELGLDLQPRLLRVLERRHVKRVGATHYKDVDVRVIAATNNDLREAVNARRFRSDLYYRLAVIEVELPALRQRIEDIPVLVERLLGNLGTRHRAQAAELIDPGFLANLAGHRWPGNVRELRNYLERCLAMHERVPFGPPIDDDGAARSPTALADLADATLPLKTARERWNHTLEAHYLTSLLEREGGNVSAAARAAEVDRAYFHRMLRRHGLR